MLDLTYATNPHERVLATTLPADVKELSGRPISINALQDLLVGKGILVDAQPAGVAFIKHKMPVMAFTADTPLKAIGLLRQGIKDLANVEFGTIVVRGIVGANEMDALNDIRFHTLAADAFDDAAKDWITSSEVQKKNRGVVAVAARTLPTVTRHGIFAPGAEVMFEDLAGSPSITDFPSAIANGRWVAPPSFDLALRVLAHARTISVVAANTTGVSLVRCGFYDGLTALRETARALRELGGEASDWTILTDGCFGVRSPLDELRGCGATQFVFCGGKANDENLLAELDAAGIGAFCTRKRLFYY